MDDEILDVLERYKQTPLQHVGVLLSMAIGAMVALGISRERALKTFNRMWDQGQELVEK